MRLAAISIDLDEIPCYTAIHGLPQPAGDAAHAVYGRALPRYAALLQSLGLRATFFVIGNDLAEGAARSAIARLAASGHEIGNHTLNHRYDFSRLPTPIASGARITAAGRAFSSCRSASRARPACACRTSGRRWCSPVAGAPAG